MTLELVVGPVRSGKLGVLLDRFAAACEAGGGRCCSCRRRSSATRSSATPASAPARVLGGEVVTLDALIERVLGGEVAVASEALDRVAPPARRARARAALGLRPVALASALERLARECDRAGAAPGALERALGGDARLAPAYAAYEAALAATGRARRGQLVVRAAERLERELAAWGGAPVFAYGFDDLSAAQLRLLAALAGRCDLLLALPVRARAAAARLARTSPSSGWPRAPSASRRCGPRPTARPRASSRSRAARSRRAQRAAAARGRCRAARRGGGHGRRGDGRRRRGLPASAARPARPTRCSS